MTTDWAVVGLTGALVIITAYYAWQNRRMVTALRKQSDAAVYLDIQARMAVVSALRDQITRSGFPEDSSNWNEPQAQIGHSLAAELEGVSFLAVKGLVDPELVMSSHAAVFNDSWILLRPLIERHREATAYPQQREHFEVFVGSCREWLHRRGRRV